MTAATPETLPCPFCGSAPEWNLGQKGDGTPWRYIACSECEAMGPHVADWELSAIADNDHVLIAAWNRRSTIAHAIQAERNRATEAERERIRAEVQKWKRRDHLSLHAGEVTAQEFRTVVAVLIAIEGVIRNQSPAGE